MSEPPGDGTLEQIRRLLARQTKMLAIKLYRDSTGVGLTEAKEAVERIQAGKAPAKPASPPPVGAEARAVGEALRAGNQIEAIRLYRAATGAGLREAKLAIDAIVAEKRAGRRPPAPAGNVVDRRRLSPILVLLALAAVFGTVFGVAMLVFAKT